MTFKHSLFLASLAIAIALPCGRSHANTTGHATSLGTSRNQTIGGSNRVKLSIMNGSSIAAAREIVGTIYNRPVQYQHANGGYYGTTSDLRTMLESGFTIAHRLPVELSAEADAISVRPWTIDDEHLLSIRVTRAVAQRLGAQSAKLIHNAERLHTKGEITDASLASARAFGGAWQQAASHFVESEKVLVKNKVAIELDK